MDKADAELNSKSVLLKKTKRIVKYIVRVFLKYFFVEDDEGDDKNNDKK